MCQILENGRNLLLALALAWTLCASLGAQSPHFGRAGMESPGTPTVSEVLASSMPTEAPDASLPGGIGYTGSAFSLPLDFLDREDRWALLLGYRGEEQPAEAQASAGWLAAWNPVDVWVEERLTVGLEYRPWRHHPHWSVSLSLQRESFGRRAPAEEGAGALLELALSF